MGLKSKTAILNLIILNVIGIMVNIPIVFGGRHTYFNFIFSFFYLFAWVGFGIYFYTKKELIIYIYMLGYWIMVMGVCVLELTISMLNAQVAFALSKFSMIGILLHIIVFTPLYGLKIPFKISIKNELFATISISVIFVILSTLAIAAINMTRKNKK